MVKCHYKDSFKKTFCKNQCYISACSKSFCALPKSVKTLSNLNNSKTPKEQIKVE